MVNVIKMVLKLYNGIQLVVIINFGNFKKKIQVFIGLVHGMILHLKLVIIKKIYILIKGKNIYGSLLVMYLNFDY
jgi:hypothetical protein